MSDDKEKDGGEEKEDGAKDDKADEKKREGRYQGVPTELLLCFVCNKSMWDGESFQNHIRGKRIVCCLTIFISCDIETCLKV